MPMVKWRLEPTAVCRIGQVDSRSKKAPAVDLSDVTNYIFANIIRQLSCLCTQSADMFDELHMMAEFVFRRANALKTRVASLKLTASALNPTAEEVSLVDAMEYKPFKSNVTKDPSFSRQRPKAVVDIYHSGQSVPAFEKLNQFRDDGKDCVKMYTNPDFFFELWCSQIKKEVNEKRPKRKKRQEKPQAAVTIRAPKNVKQEELIKKVQRQNEGPPVKPKPVTPSPASNSRPPLDSQRQSLQSEDSSPPNTLPRVDRRRKPSTSSTHTLPETPAIPPSPRTTIFPGSSRNSATRPNVPPPPPPPPSAETNTAPGRGRIESHDLPPPPPSPPAFGMQGFSSNDLEEIDVMPPPPPVPPVLRTAGKSSNRGTLYCVSDFNPRETAFFPPPPPTMVPEPPASIPSSTAPPPPPPPPPPPAPVAVPQSSSGSILPTPESAFQLRSVAPAPQKRESRNDLLHAIRAGITLRKVEETNTENAVKQTTGQLFDVQTILEMRRKAMEEESDGEEDDSTWDE